MIFLTILLKSHLKDSSYDNKMPRPTITAPTNCLHIFLREKFLRLSLNSQNSQKFSNVKNFPVYGKQSMRLRKPISAGERLAVALRYLVTGDSMQTISFSFRLGHSTVCDIIDDTCEAIWETFLLNLFLLPKTVMNGRKSVNFPHCVGAIDGKHIMIQAPANAGSQYYNFKGTHSIVLLAVCDYNYCFTLLNIGDYGRLSDGGVLSNSSFGNAMKTNSLALPDADNVAGIKSPIPYFFVGDQAFPLSTNMLRPYLSSYLQLNQRIFNYRLSRALRVIEKCLWYIKYKVLSV